MSQEWITWTLLSLIFIFYVLFLAQFLNKSQKKMISYLIGGILIIDFITKNAAYVSTGKCDVQYNLPIELCDISSLICCFLPFIKNKKNLFQFVYYAGITGGIMAILTPQMNYFDGTLRYYFSYYISHSLIIALPIFMFLHLDMKLPRLSWFRVCVNLNILMAIIMPINFLLGSNYMFVNSPPEVNNPFVIGEWPYYILLWQVFVIIFAYMIYTISIRKLIL